MRRKLACGRILFVSGLCGASRASDIAKQSSDVPGRRSRGQEKCSRVFVYSCAFLSDSYNLSYSLARRHQRVVYIREGE